MPACRVGSALTALLVPLTLVLALLGPSAALAITQNGVLARAQRWIDSPVRYSQARRHLGYRTDCSGYVSMCWKTGTSWSTRSFHTVTHRIPSGQLRPGDALLKKGYHIRLFYGWLDEGHTQYVAYEAGNGRVAVCRVHSIRDDMDFGYVPVRFDHISSSPASRNLLQNGSFDSWARSWGIQPEEPVWWQVEGPWGEAVVSRAKRTFHTARNSLALINPLGDPVTYTGLSQSANVVAGTDYRASAWAKTAADPAGLELKLVYLDATGAAIAETSTTGAAAGVDNERFKLMSARLTAPAEAARALVSIRIAGSTTVDESGTVIPARSTVMLDDVSLVRP
jgi:hypothetical protein